MAIKKDITDRRLSLNPGGLCWRTFSRKERSVLRLELRSGKTFLLPYLHWSHAELEKANDVEELVIQFSSHVIRAEGENLMELLLELQACNVELLREVPDDFRPHGTGAVIRALRVESSEMHEEGRQ